MKRILYAFASIGVCALSVVIGYVAYLVAGSFIKYESICGYFDGAFTVASCVLMQNFLYKKQKI